MPGPYRTAAPNEAALADRDEIEWFRAVSLRSRRRSRALASAVLLAGIGAVPMSLFAFAHPDRVPVVAPRVPTSYEPLPPPMHACVGRFAHCNYFDDCWELFEGPPPTSLDSPLLKYWDGRRGYWLPVEPWRLSLVCAPIGEMPQVPDCDRMREPERAACRVIERARMASRPSCF